MLDTHTHTQPHTHTTAHTPHTTAHTYHSTHTHTYTYHSAHTNTTHTHTTHTHTPHTHTHTPHTQFLFLRLNATTALQSILRIWFFWGVTPCHRARTTHPVTQHHTDHSTTVLLLTDHWSQIRPSCTYCVWIYIKLKLQQRWIYRQYFCIGACNCIGVFLCWETDECQEIFHRLKTLLAFLSPAQYTYSPSRNTVEWELLSRPRSLYGMRGNAIKRFKICRKGNRSWPRNSVMMRRTDWLTDWLTGWLADRLTDWLTGWLADRLTDWLTDWLVGWQTDWLTDWLTLLSIKLIEKLTVPQLVNKFPHEGPLPCSQNPRLVSIYSQMPPVQLLIIWFK